MNSRVPLVLVAGASGSGKTSACALLTDVVVVSADDYYLDERNPRVPRRGGLPDWNTLDSLDWPTLERDVDNLRSGGTVQVPVFDMRTSRRVGARSLAVRSARAVVVEGIFAFRLRNSGANPRVLLDCSALRLLFRGLVRDVAAGRRSSLLRALAYNLAAIRGNHRYHLSHSGLADVVIDSRARLPIVAAALQRVISSLPGSPARATSRGR